MLWNVKEMLTWKLKVVQVHKLELIFTLFYLFISIVGFLCLCMSWYFILFTNHMVLVFLSLSVFMSLFSLKDWGMFYQQPLNRNCDWDCCPIFENLLQKDVIKTKSNIMSLLSLTSLINMTESVSRLRFPLLH